MHIVLAWIERKEAVLQTQFPETSLWRGQWGFPGGKVEKGETSIAALYRECQEELGITLNATKHLYTHRQSPAMEFEIWHVSAFQGEPCAREQQILEWISKDKLLHLPMPEANQQFLPILLTLV